MSIKIPSFSLNLVDIGNTIYLIAAVLSAAYLIYFVILLIFTFSKKEKSERKIVHFQSNNNVDSINSPKLTTQENEDTNKNILPNSEVIKIGLSSIVGTRKYQQDSAIAIDDNTMRENKYQKCIAVLCDGMGGMDSGDIASAISAKTLFNDYIKISPTHLPDFFLREVKKIDKIVSGLTNEKNEVLNSGSTLVSVAIENGNMYWVSVGDSRIYLIRGNKMVQLTTDHNYYYLLRQQAENGMISFEEAENNPKGEALISYIGLGHDGEIGGNQKPIQLRAGDLILLCSDGLYKALSDQEIYDIVSSCNNNVTSVATALTSATMMKQRKTQDNTTVVLIKYNGFITK